VTLEVFLVFLVRSVACRESRANWVVFQDPLEEWEVHHCRCPLHQGSRESAPSSDRCSTAETNFRSWAVKSPRLAGEVFGRRHLSGEAATARAPGSRLLLISAAYVRLRALSECSSCLRVAVCLPCSCLSRFRSYSFLPAIAAIAVMAVIAVIAT
jgi:hypothetical protein